MIPQALHHLNQMIHLSPVITVLLTGAGLSVLLTLLVAVTSRPSNDPDFPPRL